MNNPILSLQKNQIPKTSVFTQIKHPILNLNVSQTNFKTLKISKRLQPVIK